MSVPIWRKKLKAGVEQATELERRLKEAKRGVLAEIEAGISDLMQRIPSYLEAASSAGGHLGHAGRGVGAVCPVGVRGGNFNALDLLDAEHVLFDAETAISRAQADYAIRVALLEGQIGEPLEQS